MIDYSSRTSFENWSSFDAFLQSINEDPDWYVLDSYNSKEIDLGFLKRIFKNKNTGKVWELAEPVPSFRGSWKKLEE